MTAVACASPPLHDLPSLIDRAATMLSGAKNAAEVLEAREAAGLAYDVAKRSARLQRAKAAHDDLVAAAHRAQAHALEIEACAKHRLADEYDAAQERGEVQKPGGDRVSNVPDRNNAPTVSDLGLSRKDIHEARLVRDAERVDPGIVRRTLDEGLARGEEPTRAALRRAARDRLQRSVDRLKSTEASVQRLEAEKPAPLTDAERARRAAVFGTPEDRAIHERLVEIVERIDEQPTPGEAVRRIPPASRHAVDTVPVRRAAAWLDSFSTLYEQEVQNGTNAFE
jgi:hypothetical protein